jgi:hypothetical protein
VSGRLLLRQASALWAFKYEVIDAAGQAIGSVEWPNLAQAKNARLRWHEAGSDAGDVRLLLRGRNLRYRQEILKRAWANDWRLTLEAGGVVCASLDVVHDEATRRPLLTLTNPVQGRLLRQRAFLRWTYTIALADGRTGFVREPALLSFRRDLEIVLDGVPDELLAFLGIVVLSVKTGAAIVRW